MFNQLFHQVFQSLFKPCFIILVSLLLLQTAGAEEYQLYLAKQTVNITGVPVEKITVNGSIPGPTLVFTEGEEAIIHVTNHMKEPSSVHWHGILLPAEMDGVEHFNGYRDIAAGETFTYRFKVRQTGTYWYHAHTNGQEQDGLYGSMIFKPAGKDPINADSDYVVVISDFTDENSANIQANLKLSSDYYNHARQTLGDFFTDVKEKSFKIAWHNALDWGAMRMSPTDLADVSGYTFLVNGLTPEQNWTGIFKPGEKVRLRFINASAMSFYDVRLMDNNHKSLKMIVVQADGQNVEPVSVNEFRISVAETYDVIVTPTENKAYTIVAEPIDRSGFALATLAPHENMQGEMPTHRPRAVLTMADMGGMDMSNMDHEHMSDAELQEMMLNMKSGWSKAGTPRGDKALSYSDLRYAGIQKDTREPDREIVVTLDGNMERYIWTLDGKTYENAKPIQLKLHERVKLTFINKTMMAHPMHLHGMFVQLDNGQPMEKLPDKHVVIVPPGKSYSVLLTADEPGEWAFHCHLLYHMASGMMNKVIVATLDSPDQDTMHETHKASMSQVADHHAINHHAFKLQAEQGEARDGSLTRWDLDGWIGGDDNKLWLKNKVDRVDSSTETNEFWALYSHNLAPFWDAQIGLRYDRSFYNHKPQTTSYLTLGFNGLAPSFLETEAHIFVSDEGDVSFRVQETNNFLITQKLVLKPYLEANLFAQDVPDLNKGKGLSNGELGLQLRYEITRKFAPYIDLRYEHLFGDTAAIANRKGERENNRVGSIGLQLMF